MIGTRDSILLKIYDVFPFTREKIRKIKTSV